MAYVLAGIKEAYFSGGTGAFPDLTTELGSTAFGLGIRNTGTFTASHINEMTDKNGRKFPNMINFKADLNTFQINNIALLKNIISSATSISKTSAAALAIITGGAINDGTHLQANSKGGIFVFDSTTGSMGCDWEIVLSMKERLLKLVFERNMKYADGLTFLNNAGSSASVHFVAGALPNIDKTKVVQGYVSLPVIPSGITPAYFGDTYLVDWSISIKSKGNKNGFGVSMISGVTVEIKATASGVDYLGMKQVLTHEVPGDVTIDFDISGSDTKLIFGQYGLTKLGNIEISDEKREATFTITGEYDIDFTSEDSDHIHFNTFL